MMAHTPLTEKELDELLARVKRGTMPVDVEDLVRDLRAARAALRGLKVHQEEPTDGLPTEMGNPPVFVFCGEDEPDHHPDCPWLAAKAALPPED